MGNQFPAGGGLLDRQFPLGRGGGLRVSIAAGAEGTLANIPAPDGWVWIEQAVTIPIKATGNGTEQTVPAMLYPNGGLIEDTTGEFKADAESAGYLEGQRVNVLLRLVANYVGPPPEGEDFIVDDLGEPLTDNNGEYLTVEAA